MTEEIITNEKTGGQKGAKPEAYSMLPWPQLREVARVYEMGARKYAPYNWTKGYDWSLSFSSLIRHAESFWSGEDTDPESGLPHMAHAVFHCLALMYFAEHHPELDDRHIASQSKEPELKIHSVVEFVFDPYDGPIIGTVLDIREDSPGPYHITVASSNGSEYNIGREKHIKKVLT